MQIFAPALPLGGDRPAVLVLRARVRACVCVFKKIVCVFKNIVCVCLKRLCVCIFKKIVCMCV